MRAHEPTSLKSWLKQHLAETIKLIVRLLSETVLLIVILTSVWAVAELKEYFFKTEGARPPICPSPSNVRPRMALPVLKKRSRRVTLRGC